MYIFLIFTQVIRHTLGRPPSFQEKSPTLKKLNNNNIVVLNVVTIEERNGEFLLFRSVLERTKLRRQNVVSRAYVVTMYFSTVFF